MLSSTTSGRIARNRPDYLPRRMARPYFRPPWLRNVCAMREKEGPIFFLRITTIYRERGRIRFT
jgi:hypothetical protein